MSPAPEPVYLNWEFWTALFAAVAVALSQLPPVHLWFRRRRLEVEVHNRISISHKVGNPNLGLYLSIRNVGGRPIRVETVSLAVTRDGAAIGTFPAQTYFESQNPNSAILFVPFVVKPEDGWAHGAMFLNYFDRATEKLYRPAEIALKTNITEKLNARPKDQRGLVEADPVLVKPLMDLFERLFVWIPGEYAIDLTVHGDGNSVSRSRRYRFTLYESDSAELRSFTNDYKHGGGIYYRDERHFSFSVPLTAVETSAAQQ